MENESYKKLYYHAFNCLSELTKEIQKMQIDLEELYLEMEDGAEASTD